MGEGLPVSALGFSPTGEGCFEKVSFERNFSYVDNILKQGGQLVNTTAGVRIVVPFDPMKLAYEDIPTGRYRANDMIVITQFGFILRPREEMFLLPSYVAEVVELPLGMKICAPEFTPKSAVLFELPAPQAI